MRSAILEQESRTFARTPGALATRRRAALLLEVIVAFTILVGALGVIGAQLIAGLQTTMLADEQARAANFADRMLSLLSLDPDMLAAFLEDPRQEGDFGDQYPGWFWAATVEPTPIEGLGQVRIDVLHQADPERQRDRESARIVRTVHFLKAAPQGVDLQRDFGFTQAQVDQLLQNAPLAGFDPLNLNPQLIAQLITPETLMDMLPMLLPLIQQLGGGALPDGVTPDQIADLIGGGGLPIGGGPGGQPGGQGGGAPNPLRDLIESMIGGQLTEDERRQIDEALDRQGGQGGQPGGQRPGGGRGGRGGGGRIP